MKLADFDYELPPERIAQEPLGDRSASRLLVVDRAAGTHHDRMFRDLPEYLAPGDCLVINDTKVFPSRLYGRRAGVQALPVGDSNPKKWQNLSGRVEVFLVRPVSGDERTWKALVRPGRKMPVGEVVQFGAGLKAGIIDRGEFGERTVRFDVEGDLYEALDRLGHTPLPPYIRRGDRPDDRARYQTVYARERGSVAAPTAGLHFTPEVLEACRAAGADVARATLHVGLGTFQPLHTEVVEDAALHPETFRIADADRGKILAARRVVAVGTTSVRAIEADARGDRGETSIFIYPGFAFQITGALLTNFHLPRSSLLLLVCAFGGTDLVLEAYHHAVASEYRFYSYGDAMLIL